MILVVNRQAENDEVISGWQRFSYVIHDELIADLPAMLNAFAGNLQHCRKEVAEGAS